MNFFLLKHTGRGPGAENNYRGNIVERHHAQKKDKPSGTAVDNSKHPGIDFGGKVEVASVREGDTVGMHLVMFDSTNDNHPLYARRQVAPGLCRGRCPRRRMAQRKTGFTSSLKLWTAIACDIRAGIDSCKRWRKLDRVIGAKAWRCGGV